MAMDDKYIDNLTNYSGKEKQWLKEYRDVMLMKLKHVDEKESSVTVLIRDDSQKELPFVLQEDPK